jgi:hypothetical protein
MQDKFSDADRWELRYMNEHLARLQQELEAVKVQFGKRYMEMSQAYEIGPDDVVDVLTGVITRKLVTEG